MKGILIDDSGNLQVVNGALQIGDRAIQDAILLIGSFTGELKGAPLLGGNAQKMINGVIDPFWAGNVKSQLKSINIIAKELGISEDGVYVIINN
jgi:hypothetical protein